ncbi:MAG: hypothetical protein DMF79_14565 [Acidobacteria bacterium]|nr:MAG: hypothetical protein DMF79_14565 [Acidobacteriota bacterium]
MLTVGGWFRFCPPRKSSKIPCRCRSVGTTAKLDPGSTRWRQSSTPRKKNALSRLLLKSVPGIRMGPLRLAPG